jgi:ferric-dicitrate binding protein FerR (iron transport regulator)
MQLPKERIYYLLDVYISRNATAEEEDELMNWLIEANEDSELKSYMLSIWNAYSGSSNRSPIDWDELYARVMQSSGEFAHSKVRNINWKRWIAAATVLMVFAVIAYKYLVPGLHQPVMAKIDKPKDIAPPSGNKAVLTLADGTKIEIDSSNNGTLATQGNVQIVKQSSGEISYAGAAAGEVSYNTLSVPRGSKPLNLVLEDGSRVWINVGSKLTYPTAFKGEERRVKMSGEAYFEIAHQAKTPFVVEHQDIAIRVLGTHFNVNTYEDEAEELITLLKGSVQITKNHVSQLLKPGQQASISQKSSDNIHVINDADLEEVMAWKEGKFRFNENTDITAIMRQISRWYNVDIEYKGKINQRFWGSVSKNVNLSQVLKILEATGGVKFSVQGSKIIVMPA